MSKGLSPIRKFKAKCKKKMQDRYPNLKPSLNNDFMKPCPNCDGKGEVKSATKGLDGYDLEDCSQCDGQGFIKS